jgi:hypothetical protein
MEFDWGCQGGLWRSGGVKLWFDIDLVLEKGQCLQDFEI